MPVDRHRVRKWHTSLVKNCQVNVLGSHRKGKRLSGPPLNQRVLVLFHFLSDFQNLKILYSRYKIPGISKLEKRWIFQGCIRRVQEKLQLRNYVL